MGLVKLYQWLYSRVGGRPWTHIIRDDQKSHPLAYIILAIVIGVMITKLVGKKWWWILLAMAFGVLLGHFFW